MVVGNLPSIYKNPTVGPKWSHVYTYPRSGLCLVSYFCNGTGVPEL